MKRDDWIAISVFALVMIYVGSGLWFSAGKSCDTEINYIVIQDFNYTGNSTLVQVSMDCMKECHARFAMSGTSAVKDCYAQCNKAIGVE